jgi:hypothetical protein
MRVSNGSVSKAMNSKPHPVNKPKNLVFLKIVLEPVNYRPAMGTHRRRVSDNMPLRMVTKPNLSTSDKGREARGTEIDLAT